MHCVCNSGGVVILLIVQRTPIGEHSVTMVNHFLELIAREIKTIKGNLCNKTVALQQQVWI